MSQLNKLELEHKAQTQEAEALHAAVADSKAETLTVREELIGEHAKEISLLSLIYSKLPLTLAFISIAH